MDRKEIKTQPNNLPTPQEFRGKLFAQTITEDQDMGDINHLLDDMVRRRRKTIAQLREVVKKT